MAINLIYGYTVHALHMERSADDRSHIQERAQCASEEQRKSNALLIMESLKPKVMNAYHFC